MNLFRILPLAAGLLVAGVCSAAVEAPFIDDLDAARKQAKAEHKDILIDFTGSDWCGWCVTLDKEVFHTPEFKAGYAKNFVAVQLDFPQGNKPSAEIQKQRRKWKSEVKSSSFPDVLLADENGKVYAKTGYRAGGPKFYLEHLESLRARRILRDKEFALAEKAEGLGKARHLDAALSALQSDKVLLTHYKDTIKEITTLDAEDKAGLQSKYKALHKRKQCEGEIVMLCQGKDGPAMIVKLKEYAARPDIAPETKQYALYMAGAMGCERVQHDYPQALEFFKQALAVAPDSPLAENSIKDAVKRVEAQIVRTRGKAPAAKSR